MIAAHLGDMQIMFLGTGSIVLQAGMDGDVVPLPPIIPSGIIGS